jgi:hypothetical protein
MGGTTDGGLVWDRKTRPFMASVIGFGVGLAAKGNKIKKLVPMVRFLKTC